LVEQGRFALENARQIVDYFSEVNRKILWIISTFSLIIDGSQIFKIDYPLPKVDLLAVHEFVINSLSLY
jgi:hypothetical protein